MAQLVAMAFLTLALQGDAAQTLFTDDPSAFNCRPNVLTRDDTLVLRKRSVLLRELAVRRPGEQVPHFLVVDLPPERMKPLMSTDELSRTSEVRVNVPELIGLPWKVDASAEPVFTVPGTYEFWLSTNLESEDGAYVCRVTYRPDRN